MVESTGLPVFDPAPSTLIMQEHRHGPTPSLVILRYLEYKPGVDGVCFADTSWKHQLVHEVQSPEDWESERQAVGAGWFSKTAASYEWQGDWKGHR